MRLVAHRFRWGVWALAGTALAAAAATAYSSGASFGGPDAEPTAAPAVQAPLGVEAAPDHVHRLGVDPADGALFAARHYGLFRISSQVDASRVAPHDIEALAISGPNQFLWSGHRDPREAGPSSLGLIASDDAGMTSGPVSAPGGIDFHVLHAAHGRVYGYGYTPADPSTGSLFVSDEKRSFVRRSTLPLIDFVVSPDDSEKLLATSPFGLQASADGGRNWGEVPGAPQMRNLAWTSGGLFGLSDDGGVHSSLDAGATWTSAGSAGGESEAMTVGDRQGTVTIYVALADGRIVSSMDGGGAFSVQYTG